MECFLTQHEIFQDPEWESIEEYFAEIYGYSKIMKTQMEFYQNTLKQFEENKELLQIYNNLKKGKYDKEYIKEKIYFLYETLYAEEKNKEISSLEMDWIIDVKEIDEIPKKISEIKQVVETRKQVEDLLVNDLNYLNQDEIVLWLADSLRKQKDIKVENKLDIIYNINEIIDEVISERKTKEKIEEAKRERDRLLKGDLSKEKEYKGGDG